MRKHHRNTANKLGMRMRALLAAFLLLIVSGLAAVATQAPAWADTGGYPDAGAADCSAQFGIYSWCKNGSWLSSRGYAYRNCTDYVAWKIDQVFGIQIQHDWGNAADWESNAHGKYGYPLDSSPQAGDIAVWGTEVAGGYGHVAYVAAVSNGVATFDEYNVAGTGAYTNSYTSSNHPGAPSRPDWYIHMGTIPTSGGTTPSDLRGDLTAVDQANGLEEVFYVGGDNAIWYRWQNTDGSWTAEHTLKGGAKNISATRTLDGRIGLFYVGGDNAIWYRWQTAPNVDSWSTEHTLGGGASQLTAVTQPDGTVGVFYVGGDNAIWYRWQNTDGSWSSEETLEADTKAIGTALTTDGRIELFYLGSNHTVSYREQVSPNTDSWSAEQSFAGGASQLTAVTQPDGTVGVFYVGGDNAIWYRWQSTDGSWSVEHTLKAGVATLSAARTIDGKIELFYVGGDNAVWHRWQLSPNTDTWSAEARLGGGVG